MDNEHRCHLAAACVHVELYSQFVNLIARKEFGVCGLHVYRLSSFS